MATQPCPCGCYTDPAKECTCSLLQIQKYMAKISGPLLDRIDLHIEVPAVKYRELASKSAGEASRSIRHRIIAAREVQRVRFAGRKDMYSPPWRTDMQSQDIRQYCAIDDAGEELLKMAITKLGLSVRAYDRILKVARTIADLAGQSAIRPEHMPPGETAARQRSDPVQESG